MRTDITLKNDLIEIERLAGRVRDFGRENRLPEDLVWEIRLVLEEIVTNIISYGYEDRAEHAIAVALVTSEQDITLRIRDDARPFNPLEQPVPDLEIPIEDRGIGGLGIHIVREIMDEIDYKREENVNLLVMTKHK